MTIRSWSPLSVPMSKRKAAAAASESSPSEDNDDMPGLDEASDSDNDSEDERADEGEDDDGDGDGGGEGRVSGTGSSSSSSSSSGRRYTKPKNNGNGKGVPKTKSTRKKRAEMITLGEAEEAAADIDSRKIHKDTRSRYKANLRAIKDFAVHWRKPEQKWTSLMIRQILKAMKRSRYQYRICKDMGLPFCTTAQRTLHRERKKGG